MPQYPKEKLWKIYEKLPEDLQAAIFSEETAENIRNACEENNVDEEKISEVARLTGSVLLGLLLPEELQGALETGLKLEAKKAKKIAFHLSRYVFRPVQASLKLLYEEEKPEEKKAKKQPKKKDVYRELVE